MKPIDERVAQTLLRVKLVRIRDLLDAAFEHAAHAFWGLSRGEDVRAREAVLHNMLSGIEDDLATISSGFREYEQHWGVLPELRRQANELVERALHLSNMDSDLRHTFARSSRRRVKRSMH
jgi:hypothetical protein